MSFNRLGLYIDRGRENCQVSSSALAKHRYTNTNDTLATIGAANYFPDYLDARQDEVLIGDMITIRGSDDYRDYKITSVSPLVVVEETLSDNPFNQSLNTGDDVTFQDVTVNGSLNLDTLSLLSLTANTINNTTLNSNTAIISTLSATTGTMGSLFVSGTSTLATVSITTSLTLPTSGGTPSNFNYYEETAAVTLTVNGPFAAPGTVDAFFTRAGRFVNLYLSRFIAAPNAVGTNEIIIGGIPARFRVGASAGEPLVGATRVVVGGTQTSGQWHISKDVGFNDQLILQKEDGTNFSTVDNNGFDWLSFVYPYNI